MDILAPLTETGNRLSQTDYRGTTAYAYDAGDRLTSVTPPGGPVPAYTYDPTGNQTSAGADRFAYDLAGRLVRASVGPTAETYTWSGDGVRRSAARGSATTEFLTDRAFALPQTALERDGNGKLLRRYTYGLDLLSQTTPTKGPYWYHHDGLGSVSDVTSPGGTSLIWTEYTPFGAARASASTSQAPLNYFRFTGEYADQATALYHLRARAYDPVTGRFLSVDPLSPSLDAPYVGAYVYVGNNPVRYVDPSGENPALACLTPLTAPVCAKLTAEAALLGWAAVLSVAALVTELAGDTPAAVSVPVSPSARDNWRAEELWLLTKNKQTRTRIRGLERQIEEHERDIRSNPDSRDRNHWEWEIKNWQRQIDALKGKLPGGGRRAIIGSGIGGSGK